MPELVECDTSGQAQEEGQLVAGNKPATPEETPNMEDPAKNVEERLSRLEADQTGRIEQAESIASFWRALSVFLFSMMGVMLGLMMNALKDERSALADEYQEMLRVETRDAERRNEALAETLSQASGGFETYKRLVRNLIAVPPEDRDEEFWKRVQGPRALGGPLTEAESKEE